MQNATFGWALEEQDHSGENIHVMVRVSVAKASKRLEWVETKFSVTHRLVGSNAEQCVDIFSKAAKTMRDAFFNVEGAVSFLIHKD